MILDLAIALNHMILKFLMISILKLKIDINILTLNYKYNDFWYYLSFSIVILIEKYIFIHFALEFNDF